MKKAKNIKKENDRLDAIFEFIFDIDSNEADELDSELIDLGYNPDEMSERAQSIVQKALDSAAKNDNQMIERKEKIDWGKVDEEREAEHRRFKTYLDTDLQSPDHRAEQVVWLKQAIVEIEKLQPSFSVEHRNFEQLSQADLQSLIQEVKYLLKINNLDNENGAGFSS